MKEEPTSKIFENNAGEANILNPARTTLNESEFIPNINIQQSKIILEKPTSERIALYKVSKTIEKKNIYKNNEKYRLIIKKIAQKLKKRVKFPKCKIFKFYLSYRTLILRIAKGIKQTAKKFNFWEKLEKSNITEQEINQIQEIAITACKYLEEGSKKLGGGGGRKKIPSSNPDIKSKKNIKIGLSLFKKESEKEEILKNQNLNSNDKKSEIEKNINFLRGLNPKENTNIFMQHFSKFLENNNIEIFPDTKLPYFIKIKSNYFLTYIEFWINYINYISIKYKNNLSIYSFINFIDVFYTWNTTNNKIFNDFNTEIKNQINTVFTKEAINDFFTMNKIKSLDDIFARYKNIYFDYKYKEVKINIKESDCQCPICTNNGFINKIINYNKKHNEISKENNISYISKIENKKEIVNKKKEKSANKRIKKNKKSSDADAENLDEVKTDKYNDVDIFEYLQKIEKRKDEEENKTVKEKKNRSQSKNKKNKSKPNKNKYNKNKKIQAIFDLLSIDGDLDGSDNSDNSDNGDNENSATKAPKRNKSNKNRKKQYP